MDSISSYKGSHLGEGCLENANAVVRPQDVAQRASPVGTDLRAVRHLRRGAFGEIALRVNMKLKRLTGERPSTVLAWRRVAEGNCVAERRGGKQPEANLSSQSSQTRRLNPIRPVGVASLRRRGEALALSLPKAITKHDHTIAKDSEGGWDEKAGKAEQLSVEILPGATESGEEVRALIVALKRVTTVEPRGVGR